MRHVLLSLFLLIMPLQAATAQDDMDDDTQAIVERIITLIEEAVTYTSYINRENSVTEQSSIISVPALEFELLSSTTVFLSATRAVSLGDDPFGRADVLIEVLELYDAFVNEYTVIAEVVLVDGVLYLRTEIDDEEIDDVLALGEEWRIIEDDAQLLGLQLSEFTNTFASEDDLLAALPEIASSASRITIGQAELQEAMFETITFSFSGAAFLSFSQELVDLDLSDDGFGQLIGAQIAQSDDDVFTLTVFINEQGQLAGREIEAVLNVIIDGESVDPSLAGGTVESTTYLFQQEILLAINEPIPPVAAPVLTD